MRNRSSRLLGAAAVVFAGALAAQCGGGGGAAGEAQPQPAAPAGQPEFKPVATVDEVMDAIVIPSSQAIFDAVVYSNGELVSSPQTDDDWFNLRIHALGVAEAGNLLMMSPRAKDGGDWMKMSRDLNDQAMVVADAAQKKDMDLFLKAGGAMYNSCTTCHEKYIPAE
jgi:hypothetical protein